MIVFLYLYAAAPYCHWNIYIIRFSFKNLQVHCIPSVFNIESVNICKYEAESQADIYVATCCCEKNLLCFLTFLLISCVSILHGF